MVYKQHVNFLLITVSQSQQEKIPDRLILSLSPLIIDKSSYNFIKKWFIQLYNDDSQLSFIILFTIVILKVAINQQIELHLCLFIMIDLAYQNKLQGFLRLLEMLLLMAGFSLIPLTTEAHILSLMITSNPETHWTTGTACKDVFASTNESKGSS